MIHDVWPDAELEQRMIDDAENMVADLRNKYLWSDTACHVKALLARVRELEADRMRLLSEQFTK